MIAETIDRQAEDSGVEKGTWRPSQETAERCCDRSQCNSEKNQNGNVKGCSATRCCHGERCQQNAVDQESEQKRLDGDGDTEGNGAAIAEGIRSETDESRSELQDKEGRWPRDGARGFYRRFARRTCVQATR